MVRRGGMLTVLGVAIVLFLSGCVTRMLATRIVEAPNRHGLRGAFGDPKNLAAADAYCTATWRLPVGPPHAELAVSVLEAADYHFVSEFKSDREADGRTITTWNCKWSKGADFVAYSEPPKGTLVLLHGIMMTKESMMPWAFYFAQQGYRVVLVDLRGHGRSTGRWIGFGGWEADDLVKIADELQRRGLLAGKLGVFGESYGAVAGIHWAARDLRVATVVALAPFSDPRTAISEFARGFDPKLTAKLSDATFAAAEIKAAAMAGFAWNDVNVLDAMRRMRVPVLLFHGQSDTWILPAQSEALDRVAPSGSRREVTPQDDHITLMMRLDLVGPPALAWFEERLRDSTIVRPVAGGTEISNSGVAGDLDGGMR